ncbi:hypothetical protein BU16DRAFT_529531 [Lophium mytilinum]|uniref:Uncharacterized protein n=1 Tax=Lophium mytilinum TaxID=390894 RepID=A0A6A6QJN2_9PEZI|nr:hypothetical protein BU16DRAFT_529531 [Lophium mytilinum]
MALQANILPKRSMFDRIAIGPDGLPEREEPAGGIQYLVEENDDDSSEDAHDEQGTNEDDEAWEDIEDGEVLDTIWEDEEEPEIDQTLATSIEHQHALHPTPHDSIVKELSDHGDEKDAGETMADEIDLLTEPYDPEDPMLRPEEIAKSSTNTTQLLDQEPYDPEDPMLRPEELAMFPKHTTRLLDRVPTFTVVITEVFAFEESAGTVSASSKDTHAPPPVSLDVGIPISTEELLETQAATDSRGNLLETETELPDNVQEILSNRKKPIQGVNTVTSVLLKMLILLALTIGVCLFSYFVVPKLWESSIILFCGILGMISCRFREAGGWETNMQDSIGGAGLGVGGARRVQRDRERNEDGIEH